MKKPSTSTPYTEVDPQMAQTIHEFCEWLKGNGYVICNESKAAPEFGSPPYPTKDDNEDLIHKFFNAPTVPRKRPKKAATKRRNRVKKKPKRKRS